MKCPYCGLFSNKVLESRVTDDGNKIRRRRGCVKCLKRFTTYEVIESSPMIVIKKDGSREVFDQKKIFNGVLKACHKRVIGVEKIFEISKDIEAHFQNSLNLEIKSSSIGERVMDILKDLDEVAYVRFASIYKQFRDISGFINDLKEILVNN